MKVLVIGGGAREHAILDRLASEPERNTLLVAPGNPGMAGLARRLAAPIDQPDALVALARSEGVDLTIVGPELPLSVGVADRFQRAGCPLVGPTQAAARLETSKAYAKAFMARHGVPTARARICHTAREALQIVRRGELGLPLVLKADGLAAGKGVVIAEDTASAERAVSDAMVSHRFGPAGDCLVLEECLTGPEVSFFVLCDGTRAVPLGTAQDHKRIFDGDRGPNTGGMGAFAPSPLVDRPLSDEILRRIVEPVVQGMAAEGCPYAGFLYVGLMVTPSGPSVIEFNARLGDPEAQVILPLIAEPIVPRLLGAATGQLPPTPVRLLSETRVGVVLASRGYPESAELGQPISGLDRATALSGVSVLHAGTAEQDGQLVTAGGRVLTVVGAGPDYASAIQRAYAGVAAISFDGMQFRRDIGQKALAR